MDDDIKRKDQLPEEPPAIPMDQQDEKSDKVATGAMPPKKVLAAWVFVAMFIILMIMIYMMNPSRKLKELDEIAFRSMVTQNQIEDVKLICVNEKITYFSGTIKGEKHEKFRANAVDSANLQKFLVENQMACPVVYQNNVLGDILVQIIPVILIMGILYFFIMRQVKSSSMGAMNFGKSRAKMMSKDKSKFTFKDVAGIKEAKEEVQEIVEFLKDPKKFQKLGGRIPKGVLLMGPPGTGKTLLARSIAGEAKVPFFSISGSDFIEMFVGVGASRVRDMFEQGKKNAPCLIFVDEIDAVGRSRFSGMGGGHDEREQTLNAMLVEMDGFEANEGVIIIAATNRADVLDPALMRPGRFDRQVIIDLPTLEGREDILKMHAKKLLLGDDVDFSRVARGTTGFSGADLANLLNEAALIAARCDKQFVEHTDLEEARDKVLWGRERRSRTMDEKDLKGTAWHESGHALLQVLCEHADPLHKVTIIPRGQALGATMSLPDREITNRSKLEFLDNLVVMMGGRIAEKKFTGDISTGARMDIKMASDTARQMICAYGMSEEFGFQSFGDNQETFFMGREMTKNQSYSEETACRIDNEVNTLLSNAYTRAEEMINKNSDKLEMLVDQLLEYETMDGRDVEDLIRLGRIKSEEEREEGHALERSKREAKTRKEKEAAAHSEESDSENKEDVKDDTDKGPTETLEKDDSAEAENRDELKNVIGDNDSSEDVKSEDKIEESDLFDAI
ncbi:MAG: ATP-dependent zinc metalloprotease FtsH [Kiritimatiellae bacterium]|jgi:cell division protease FtsH|nr:ATP-dependent zinc metalloprotease FtsH [Kiritimatiellia bacterium]